LVKTFTSYSVTVDAIGQGGVQMFVDAGRPIDSALVNALIRDVLVEKIRSMVGSRAQNDNLATSDGFPLPQRRTDAAIGNQSAGGGPSLPEMLLGVELDEVGFVFF